MKKGSKKSNSDTSLFAAIIIALSLIIVGLLVFIIVAQIGSSGEFTIKDFPKISDNNIGVYNITKHILDSEKSSDDGLVINKEEFILDGIMFKVECVSYTGKICNSAQLKLTNNILVSNIYYNQNLKLIVTDEYLIIQEMPGYFLTGTINIFTRDGVKVKTILNTAQGYQDNNYKFVDASIEVVDNKLYFIESGYNGEITELYDNYVKTVELNEDFIEETILVFKGRTSQSY